MITDMEIWKPVVGYEEQYEVSINGVVKRLDKISVNESGLTIKKGKTLKTRVNNRGYVEVRLSKHNKQSTTFLHIILAKAFIPNPENKQQVNHLNGIKIDNRLENLEWCTRLENMQHASRMGLLKRTYKQVIDNCTGRTYISSYEAALDLNIEYRILKNYLNGNRRNQTCLEYAK
ncbi:NUMOD4 domain-containing protein [Sediminibacterium sp.]|uniref:NUMOD4 domain-containing protein n=1 Tax=Sediminibacterium sp. TaxID=1917865 RepID=UPI0025FD86F3|nr:NUMOD4 domain-containing protein [Sediminibacterium sp.]